jgi:hypothetical protein
MVWLATLNSLLAVKGYIREFLRPVHPIDACINAVLIGSTDLEDATDPVFIIVADIFTITLGLFFFNG